MRGSAASSGVQCLIKCRRKHSAGGPSGSMRGIRRYRHAGLKGPLEFGDAPRIPRLRPSTARPSFRTHAFLHLASSTPFTHPSFSTRLNRTPSSAPSLQHLNSLPSFQHPLLSTPL